MMYLSDVYKEKADAIRAECERTKKKIAQLEKRTSELTELILIYGKDELEAENYEVLMELLKRNDFLFKKLNELTSVNLLFGLDLMKENIDLQTSYMNNVFSSFNAEKEQDGEEILTFDHLFQRIKSKIRLFIKNFSTIVLKKVRHT